MQKKENRGQPMVLASGSIKKPFVLFSIPIFLGTLLQQLYNVIDAVVAGRLVNEDALSAIGVSVPVYLLFVSVILGLAIGITILLAQFFGAKQFEQMKGLISTMSIFLLVQLRKKFPMAVPKRSEIVFDRKLLGVSLKICTPIII